MNRQTARKVLDRKVLDRKSPRMDDGPRRPPHGPRRPIAHGPQFKAGDRVPETGIYEVVHAEGHRPPHEVVLHGEDAFPDCEHCGGSVRFRVLRTAPYIFDDEDFEPGE
jgi:hypothetical protein